MKIRIEKDRLRLQAETPAEGQFISDLLNRLWEPKHADRLPEDIANDFGMKNDLNWMTLPLPKEAEKLMEIRAALDNADKLSDAA